MFRTILHLLILSLVGLGADAAADSGTFGHAHDEAGPRMEQRAAGDGGGDVHQRQDDGGHCERCCHAHASVLPTLLLAPDVARESCYANPADPSWQAGNPPPPIPPPIA